MFVRPSSAHCVEAIVRARSTIYRALKYSNDVNAVRRHKVGRRVVRRVAGKATGRLFAKLFG